VACLQLRTIRKKRSSAKRMLRKVGAISENEFRAILQILEQFLSLKIAANEIESPCGGSRRRQPLMRALYAARTIYQ
jgi:hypothetical protein